jgi:hypothetical protein
VTSRFGSERPLAAAHHQRNQAVAASLKRRAWSGEYTVGDVEQIKNLQLHGVHKIPNIEEMRGADGRCRWVGNREPASQEGLLMFQWLWRLLYESKPAEFRSSFGLAESVEQLRAATKRSVFSALGETAAVGKVSETAVRLQRVVPMFGNSFKPFFIGRFEVRDGVTVLTGRFGLLTIVKVFMTFWLGMAFVFAGGMLLGNFSSPNPVPLFLAFQPFLMLGFGIALIVVGKWLARNDVAWLSNVIERALGNTGKSGAADALANADTGAGPRTLKVVSIVLAASGSMALLGHFPPGYLADGNRGPGRALPMPAFGDWNDAIAAGLLVLSVGIWWRRPWAWWAGFLVIGTSMANALVAMHRQVGIGPPIAIQVIFAVLALGVSVMWGLWWYAQRKHFLWARP